MKFNSLVLKVSGCCNLSCKYCYVYNQKDKSYQGKPLLMSKKIVDVVIRKTLEHCREQNIREFLFAFHGGEPLMQDLNFFQYFINTVERLCGCDIKVHYTIQTNGTLISKEVASLFDRLKIQIGVSLDGVKEVNDINRVYKNGKSTFNDVILGLENALEYEYHKRTLGILSVININHDPLDFYNFLQDRKVPRVDFLLPYYTYDTLPALFNCNDHENTPYAEWLIRLFNVWFHDNDGPDIRMFSGFIKSLFGDEYPNDLFGSYKNGLLVIESNGDIEPIDYLKACGDHFTKTKLNIMKHDISDVSNSELIKLYYHSHSILSEKCKHCPINEICGGGNLTSRYSAKTGFDNPSCCCNDILKIVIHIQNALFFNLSPCFRRRHNMELFNYQKVISELKSVHPKNNKNLISFNNQKKCQN